MVRTDRSFFKRPSRNLTGLAPIFIIATCSLALIGCMGGAALHNDLVSYSDVYAHDTNEQLLNNLARLSHSDPPYFVQLGQITAQHTYTGVAGFANASSAPDHYGGSTSLTSTEQPSFQIVPITGTNFMNAISVPISAKLFLTFFDQGKPADILARVMLDSVTLTRKKSNSAPDYHFLLKNDPLDPSYPDFLLFCIKLRDKQLGDIDYITKPKSKLPLKFTDVKLADIASATWAGMDLSPSTNVTTVNGVLTTNVIANTAEASKPSNLNLAERFDISNYASASIPYSFQVGAVNRAGSSVEYGHLAPVQGGLMHIDFFFGPSDDLASAPPATDADQTAHWLASLKMRTFMSVLSAAAKEKEKFADFPERNITNSFTVDAQGYGHFTNYLVQPILRTSQDSVEDLQREFNTTGLQEEASFSTLASVDYQGGHYVLGDLVDSNGLPLVDELRDQYTSTNGRQLKNLFSSNKEVFSLISDLYNDLAIDPKNLPVQQLIQVQ